MNINKNKKAVSAVIATSLIILITVAAVSILWTAVMPLVKDSVPKSGNSCMGVTPSIDFISACKLNTGALVVKVGVKNTGESTIESFKIYAYDSNGDIIPNSPDITTSLARNEEKSLTSGSLTKSPDKIAIAPVVSGNICDSTDKKVVSIITTC